MAHKVRPRRAATGGASELQLADRLKRSKLLHAIPQSKHVLASQPRPLWPPPSLAPSNDGGGGYERLSTLSGERLLRAIDLQITRMIEAAYCRLLTHQLDRLAKRFRLAAAEIESSPPSGAGRRHEAAPHPQAETTRRADPTFFGNLLRSSSI